jgi:hypothetical protein
MASVALSLAVASFALARAPLPAVGMGLLVLGPAAVEGLAQAIDTLVWPAIVIAFVLSWRGAPDWMTWALIAAAWGVALWLQPFTGMWPVLIAVDVVLALTAALYLVSVRRPGDQRGRLINTLLTPVLALVADAWAGPVLASPPGPHADPVGSVVPWALSLGVLLVSVYVAVRGMTELVGRPSAERLVLLAGLPLAAAVAAVWNGVTGQSRGAVVLALFVVLLGVLYVALLVALHHVLQTSSAGEFAVAAAREHVFRPLATLTWLGRESLEIVGQGPAGLGTSLRVRGRVQGARYELSFAVVEFDVGRALALEAQADSYVELPLSSLLRARLELSPQREGTRVLWQAVHRVPVAWTLNPFVMKSLRPSFGVELERFLNEELAQPVTLATRARSTA